jgi:hypothetical protein
MSYRVNTDMPWHYHIEDMHNLFGVHDWVNSKLDEGDMESLKKFLEFRIQFLKEELNETEKAFNNSDPAEIVDGLIDLCVIAIGTLDAFGCNAAGAWAEVMEANMAKEPGVKTTRPNPLGLPDLIKPDGWVGPDHTYTTGFLPSLFPGKE